MSNTTITVTTTYPGASEDVVKGFITRPLEASIGSADGIDYLTASSTMGSSSITAYIKLNYDPNVALANINAQVNAVLGQLPKGINSPVITKQTDATVPDLILGFTSSSMTPEQITAYLQNVLEPKVSALGGLSQILIMGQQQYAMRIWLNSYKMEALGVTPAEVQNALADNNLESTAGDMQTKNAYIPIDVTTDLHTADDFNNLIVANNNGNVIKIKDIGYAQLGAQTYDTQAYLNGKPAVFMGIFVAPGINPLAAVDKVLKNLPSMETEFPVGLHAKEVYTSTDYIKASLKEVGLSIIEAIAIVVIVIFLFLGAIRSVLIPVVAIPLSLVGVCSLMLMLGFSLNLLTLLAMVIAIGLVVDDAIVVLENIYRHIEAGQKPFEAAIYGAREIVMPIIVMTTTLAAVFAPIGFLGGLTGALFKEFAFTLAASVIISGVVALTFSPLLCSYIINHEVLEVRFVQKIDRVFHSFKERYKGWLRQALANKPILLLIGGAVLLMNVVLFMFIPTDLAPTEDQGFIGMMATGPSSSNIDYLQEFNVPLMRVISSFPGIQDVALVNGFKGQDNVTFSAIRLLPWGERKMTAMKLQPQMQKKLGSITGLKVYTFQNPALPGVQGPPIQFVLNSTESPAALYAYAEAVIQKAQKTGTFTYMDTDLKFDEPELVATIDRNKAALLNVSMQDIASAMAPMLSDNNVNYFDEDGYSFQVIPQVDDPLREDENQLDQITVQNASGQSFPLSTFVSYSFQSIPSTLNEFQQLNSVTISALLRPGVTIGQGLHVLQNVSAKILPKDVGVDYAAQSRQFMQEGDTMILAFMFALIMIYLVLSAQFESFRDPIIILVSVPMSICGALLPLFLGMATLNIYTEIGLICLVGLISKHGILMVEFANKLQEQQGYTKEAAIVEAASIRLRPILMTTFAMVFGVVPLVLASGAGSVSRFDIGIVLACGMTIGTCFTLFMVPTIYTYLSLPFSKRKKRKAPRKSRLNEDNMQ